jgi:hypothetical protein
MTFTLDNKKIANGTVLMMGISFEGMGPIEGNDANRGMAQPKVYTYALLKAGGLWYVTGSGRVPVAAGWLAVERWLSKDGRKVEWVREATGWNEIYPEPPTAPFTVHHLDGTKTVTNPRGHTGLSLPCAPCGGRCRIDD